ncbi:TPA_asm: P3 [Asclepias syriaca virus 1]|uniref:P3 n=1 Tax=Asclepias syriaca virus 1 TaxID=2793722 RepID=A0A8D9PH28_9RHAB|nr:P3 [Asclepias syriaca virus 1]DAF42286.1 TPA_asm: P3 [Asclepias syriaca virus 1]
MKGIISVNDAKAVIANNGSLTAAVNTSKIYEGKYRRVARKREVNVKVLANPDNNYMMRNFPLFDKADIQEMKSEELNSKYVHIGCISVSIEPLMHHRFLEKYGKNLSGVCAIIDTTFRDFDQSIISLHRFDLSSKRADFICQPNHCLSVTDGNLFRRVSVLLLFNHIDVDEGGELFNVCVGHITTCTNTLNPTEGANRDKNLTLNGTECVEYDEVKDDIYNAMITSREKEGLELIQDGDDQIVMGKKNLLTFLKLKSNPRIVVRKNFIAQNVKPKIQQKANSLSERSVSLPRNSLDLAIIRCARAGMWSGNPPVSTDDAKKKIREDRKKIMEDV